MKYNLEWLLQKVESGERIKFVFFWGSQPDRNGMVTSSCFSQWRISPFVVNDIIYNTAEHWMMAHKALLFDDYAVYEKIIKAKSAAEAKELGRQILNFDENLWMQKRLEIVIEGSLYKFNQHPDLKEFLINTKDRLLVEASPVDTIWGVGLAADDEKIKDPTKWNGLNLLGFALMEVRDQLF